MITLSTITFYLLLTTGSILLAYAGSQDKKTQTPILLIPALLALGLSAGIKTGIIILILSTITLNLPAKINKIMGKADILLFTSILTILLLQENITISTILIITMLTTSIILIPSAIKNKPIPLIYYFSMAHGISLILFGALITALRLTGVL